MYAMSRFYSKCSDIKDIKNHPKVVDRTNLSVLCNLEKIMFYSYDTLIGYTKNKRDKTYVLITPQHYSKTTEEHIRRIVKIADRFGWIVVRYLNAEEEWFASAL